MTLRSAAMVATLPPLVDADWLADHLDEVVVADVRWYLDGRSGRDAHAAGHIPGAVFVDVDTDLTAPPSAADGRHPLPSPEAFAASLGRLGIGPSDPVVAYDDAGGAMAARLGWMLRVLGRPAALLDGGIGAWDGPLEAGAVDRAPAEVAPEPWPTDSLLDADAVAAGLRSGRLVVIDARAAERYRGEVEPVDPQAGHIPGAVNVPHTGNVDADGRFLGPDALRARFAEASVDGLRDVAVYCGSGVTACHDVLAIELAGLGRARLYPGSWSQWSSDPRRPVATGDRPGEPA